MIQYYQFPSPLGISLYSIGRKKETVGPNKFPSPLGISLYSITFCKYAQGYCDDDGFRPLWGFLFIQLVQESNDRVALDKFPSPLGISLYSIEIHRKVKGEEYEFPSPLGISLYSMYYMNLQGKAEPTCFRPLWGFLFIQCSVISPQRFMKFLFPSPLGISLYSMSAILEIGVED